MTGSDPEIQAMAAISVALADLDEEVCARVIAWATDRFAPGLDLGPGLSGQSTAAGVDPNLAVTPQRFAHFADLFDQVDPSTGWERLLTGCYWLQVVEGRESFGSQSANDLLKDVGHGLDSNVAKAFTRMQQQSPALVRQLSKSGRTQQARKTYKMTTAGIAEIEGRL